MAGGRTAMAVDGLLRRLGLFCESKEEAEAQLNLLLDPEKGPELLKTKTGYRMVQLTSAKTPAWQAKVYLGPGKQRGLGSFPTPKEAAHMVCLFVAEQVLGKPLPPSPCKDRAKRGEGPRPHKPRKPRGMHVHAFRSMIA